MPRARMRRWVAPLAAAVTLMCLGRGDAQNDGHINALLESGHWREAWETTAGSGQAEDVQAVAQLARALLSVSMRSPDSYLRWFALQAAEPLTDRELAEAVRTRARADDRYERSLALGMLAHADPAGSRDEFIAALDSPFRAVRLRGLEGLAQLNDRSLTERFAEVLSGDPDPDLRAFAARALGATGSGQAALVLHRAMDDPVATVQEEAVRALVVLGDPGISAVMRRRLADSPPEARVRNIRMAGLVPDRAIIRDLGPFLGDGDPQVRSFAAAAILSILERTEPRSG